MRVCHDADVKHELDSALIAGTLWESCAAIGGKEISRRPEWKLRLYGSILLTCILCLTSGNEAIFWLSNAVIHAK